MSSRTPQPDVRRLLRDFLRGGEVQTGARLPGERELAARLGVGRAALRPALRALEAEGLLRRRAQSGTWLEVVPAPEAGGAEIALLAPFGGRDSGTNRETDPAWLHRVISAFERTAVPAGARLTLLDQSPRAADPCSVKDMAHLAAQSGAAAVVLLHPVGTRGKIAHALAVLHDANVHPVIVSSRTYPGLASQVYFDSGGGAHRATRFLWQQGHRRIGFAGAPGGHEWVQERLAGYRGALESADIAASDDWVWLPDGGERLAAAADGAWAFGQWKSLPPETRPTAIFAANDVVALGLLEAAHSASVSVPGELSLVGFDNDPGSLLAGLTTLERPTEALGETVARVTLERLAAGPDAAAVSVRLRPVLIERATVGPPGKGKKQQ